MALAKTWERNFTQRVGRPPFESERRLAEFWSDWKKKMPEGMYSALIRLLNEEREDHFRAGRASVTGQFILVVSVGGLIQRAMPYPTLPNAVLAAKAHFDQFDPETDDIKVFDKNGEVVWLYDPAGDK